MNAQPGKHNFHELLRASRVEADQSAEVMAILLNMTPEDYGALESWSYPDEETLKRLCMMNEWNYYDVQRLIINEMISPARPNPAPAAAQTGAAPGVGTEPPRGDQQSRIKTKSLGERLREVRLVTGQSMEIIALLLNIDFETYNGLEEGIPPSDEVLRRISVIYNWNYHDLTAVLRSEHAKNFQPLKVGMPYLGSTVQMAQLRQIMQEVEGVFMKLGQGEQNHLLAQMELIRETTRRHQKTS